MGILLLVVSAICVIGLIVLAVIGLNLYGSRRRNQQDQARKDEIRKKGVMAPAVVISAKNGIMRGPKNGSQKMFIKYHVEVQPEGRPVFEAEFQDWVSIGLGPSSSLGYRKEDVGRKIWVTYDPNDTSQVIFEHYDSNHNYIIYRSAFERMEQRNKEIRQTGEEAPAVILEAEDMKITNPVERDHLQQTIMRLKLEITPKNDSVYLAETQGLFANTSLDKYSVGKKVYVKFNLQDKTQVALVRSAE